MSDDLSMHHYTLLHEIYVLLDDGDYHTLLPFNLTRSQFGLLMLIGSDQKGDGQRLTTLSERLLISKSQVTRLVDHLEAAGLVQRIADPDDRRAQNVILTEAGLDQRQRVQKSYEKSLKQRFSGLDKEEQQQLKHLLSKVRHNLLEHLPNNNGYSQREHNGRNYPPGKNN